MGYLELPNSGLGGKSIWEAGAEGWGPFSFLVKKEERKALKDAAKAGEIEAQTGRTTAEFQSRLAAVQAMRNKINASVTRTEQEAALAAQHVENIRSIGNDERIRDTEVLDKALAELDELEVLVIQVHAGTLVDTASEDTQVLAQSYASAQAALAGMGIVKARAAGIEKRLAEHLEKLSQEKDRIAALEKRSRELAIQERAAAIAAQQAVEAELAEAQLDLDLEARVMAQREEFQRLRELTNEIQEEKRLISSLRDELESARRAQRRATLQGLRR